MIGYHKIGKVSFEVFEIESTEAGQHAGFYWAEGEEGYDWDILPVGPYHTAKDAWGDAMHELG